VESADAESGVKDFLTEIGHEASTELAYFFVVIPVRFQHVEEGARDGDFGQGCCFHKPIPSLDGVDPGDDGHRYPGLSNVVDPLDEQVYVVEHLGEDKRNTRVDLFFEVGQLLL